MKANSDELGELVSALSKAGVERQLAILPGARHADVRRAVGSIPASPALVSMPCKF